MESIKVLIRVRPLHAEIPYTTTTSSTIKISEDNKSISLNAHRQLACQYNHIFRPSALQSEVYTHVKYCVKSILQGYNATILAYGQTGSGKSHTMFGRDGGIRNDPGVVPRCIEDIFSGLRKAKRGSKRCVYMSFLQVYNEQVYDMFDASMKPLAVHERNGGVVINQLSEYEVHNMDQALALVDFGLKQRSIRETGMNHASSRSHSILQVKVEQTGIVGEDGKERFISSKLNLVDLAGSERWTFGGVGMGNEQISELTNINSSLHTLGRCIAALATKSRERGKLKSPSKHVHVPYRDSKLTRILQDSLSGNSKTCLVATINPLPSCADDSIGTLRFADRAHQVMTHARMNEIDVSSVDPEVQRLHDEIARLKKILQDHGIDIDPPPPQDSNLNIDLPRINQSVENSTKALKITSESLQKNEYNAEEFFDAISVSLQEGDELSHGDNRRLEILNQSKLPRYTPKEPLLKYETKPDTINEAKQQINQPLLHSAAYKRLATLLNSILMLVDSLMTTVGASASTVDDWQAAEGTCQQFGSNPCVTNTSDKSKCDRTIHDERIPCKAKVSPLFPVQNSRTTTRVNRSAKPCLSSLLKRRKELTSSVIDMDEKKLKEDLMKSRKDVEEKQQLRDWLLEREQKAENPIAAYLADMS